MNLRRSLTADLRGREYSEHTIRQYVALASQFADWFGKPVDEATRLDFLEWMNEAHSASNKRWRWLAVKSLGRMLKAEEVWDSNPADRIPMPKVDEAVMPILEDDAFAALLRTCSSKSWTDVRDRALLEVLGNTGMRRGEVCGMDVDHLDMEHLVVHVPRSKTGRARFVYMDEMTGRLVERWLRVRNSDATALWLSQRKNRLTGDGLTQMVARRAERAGVDASPHMFRRRFARNWMLDGGNQAALQTVSGWESGAMVKRYTRLAEAEIAKAEYERLNAHRKGRRRAS